MRALTSSSLVRGEVVVRKLVCHKQRNAARSCRRDVEARKALDVAIFGGGGDSRCLASLHFSPARVACGAPPRSHLQLKTASFDGSNIEIFRQQCPPPRVRRCDAWRAGDSRAVLVRTPQLRAVGSFTSVRRPRRLRPSTWTSTRAMPPAQLPPQVPRLRVGLVSSVGLLIRSRRSIRGAWVAFLSALRVIVGIAESIHPQRHISGRERAGRERRNPKLCELGD
jgi:hypothetical protein